VLGGCGITTVHEHDKIRVLGKLIHLTGSVASIGVVGVGADQLPDRQPVGSLLQRPIGMLAAPGLPRCHCLLRLRLKRFANGLIAAITSVGVDVRPNTLAASAIWPQTSLGVGGSDISRVVAYVKPGGNTKIGVHFVNFDVLGGVEVLPLAVELGCAASPLIRIA
jgi:hypothetical protein